MATPTLVTITGDLVPNLAAERVTFRIPTPIRYNTGPDVILPGDALQATVAGDGTFSLPVYGTNDPDWSPSNWNYQVIVEGDNLNYSFYAQVPYNAGTLDFSALLPAESASDGTLYAAFNHSHGSGGGAAVDSVFGRTGIVTAQSGDYTKAQVGLSAVDNTSDAAKPISTATQTALNLKANAADVITALAGKSDTGHTHGGGGGSTVTFTHGYKTAEGLVTPQTTVSWAIVTGAPTFVAPAAVGDKVRFDWSGLLQFATNQFYDLVVITGGSIARYAATNGATPGTEGDPSLYPDAAFRPEQGMGMALTCGAGDISGGNITFGFATVNPGGGGKIYASTDYPLRYSITNYGA